LTPERNPAPLDLLVEDAGDLGVLGHVPALPGLCFRASGPEEVKAIAPARIAEYVAWLRSENLIDLTPETTRRTGIEDGSDVSVVIAEQVRGAPVWESGNAAALFERDLQPLDDAGVEAYLRFTRRVLDRIRDAVASLPASERARRPAPDRRSVDETLEHVGNCVWWYCSRIDDNLPEPEEPPGEDPLDRIDRLFEIAKAFLLAIPQVERARTHVPARFPTANPNERWTHAKVCRRQAEHAWTHLRGRGLKPKIRRS